MLIDFTERYAWFSAPINHKLGNEIGLLRIKKVYLLAFAGLVAISVLVVASRCASG